MPVRGGDETDGTRRAELRLGDIRNDADAAGAQSKARLIFVASRRYDENRCAIYPSADQGIIHDGASERKSPLVE
jgi:hypothetical protein